MNITQIVYLMTTVRSLKKIGGHLVIPKVHYSEGSLFQIEHKFVIPNLNHIASPNPNAKPYKPNPNANPNPPNPKP